MKDIPGVRWIFVLGAAGFVAGFIGPMIFVPDANQGPLFGMLISGPIGAVLGLAFFGFSSLLRISAGTQWRLLLWTTLTGVLITLVLIQPGPALHGTVFNAEVLGCSSPMDVETETLKYWEQRIAKVTWATPRADWQRDMHNALQNAPGVMLALQLTRKRSVYENRKPWNRGQLFAKDWQDVYEKKSYYHASGSCDEFSSGLKLQGFEHYTLNGRMEAPTNWPPTEFGNIIDASTFTDVPEQLNPFR